MNINGLEVSQKLAVRYRDEVWNGWVEAADEIIAPTCIFHVTNAYTPSPGPAILKEFVTAYCARFPDAQFVVTDIEVEGDRVTTLWWADGIQPASASLIVTETVTDKTKRVTGRDVLRIEDNKIVEVWTICDTPDGQFDCQVISRDRGQQGDTVEDSLSV